MGDTFQAWVRRQGAVSYVKLGGVIDENNELDGLLDKIPRGTVLVDVANIEYINSVGVRDWSAWQQKLEAKGTAAVLVGCSPAIVAQLNLVRSFSRTGLVKSFYLPYMCSECDHEMLVLVDTHTFGPPPYRPPTCRCEDCDLVMDFDDHPDFYFSFLAYLSAIPDEAKLDSALTELARGSDVYPGLQRGPMSDVDARPSVPSLPLAEEHSSPHRDAFEGARGTQPGVSRRLGSAPGPTIPPLTAMRAPSVVESPVPIDHRPVYALVAVLSASIAVLAYWLVTN